jgi:outer membrane protein TolC
MYRNAYIVKRRLRSLLLLTSAICSGQEVLTLDHVLELARGQNRDLKHLGLEQAKTSDTIAAAHTRRLPQFRLYALGGQLLTRPSVEFARGVFGDYPGVGPIPSTDTQVRASRSPTALLMAQAALPLTQQYRIGLQLRQLAVQSLIQGDDTKEARQKLNSELRRTFYQIIELEGERESATRAVTALEQAERTAREHFEEKTILRADVLDVQARLEKARADMQRAASRTITQKETLNLLIGRPIETDFRAGALPDTALGEHDIAVLRVRAVTERPDVHRAELRVQISELDTKLKRAEYIPDVSLSVNYVSAFNIGSTLPANIAIAGLTIEWDVFDWGRKKRELSEKAKATNQARLQLEQAREKARLEVGATIRQMTEIRQLLTAARAAQESARESLRVAQMKFEEKAVLLKDVLSAQAAVASTDYEHRRTLLAYLSAEAELKRVLGEAL